MADNGTPESFDAQPVADQIPDAEWAALSSGQSRRKFLRNALIGSAAAAAVVGTSTTLIVASAGASPASVHPKITKQVNPSTACLSPCDASMLCFEDTNLHGSNLGCGPTTGSFWLFFTIRSVAVANNYTAEVTQSPNGGTPDFTGSSTPFALQATSSAVHVTVGGSPLNCPTTKPAGTPHDTDPVTFDVTGSTPQDVQVAIHLTWNGGTVSGSETITFNATLKDSSNQIVALPASITFTTPCP